jgi:hypothetical protein
MDPKILLAVDAVYKGKGAMDKAKADVKGVADEAEKGSKRMKTALTGIGTGVLAFGAAAGGAYLAGKQLWGLFKEGGALVDARDDFNDLAASIGSTGDAMRDGLGEATRGLMTDAEAMAAATGIMQLNLGLTGDEIEEIIGLSAQLGISQEALAKTLNTGSTRGLQELGLGIQDVKDRMAALEEQGYSTSEAMRMATLDALKDKMAIVGSAADEFGGKVKILENAALEAGDAFKMAFAEGLIESIDDLTGAGDAIEELGDSMKYAAEGAGALAAAIVSIPIKGLAQIGANSSIADLREQLRQAGLTDRDISAGGQGFKGIGLSSDAEMMAEAQRLAALLKQVQANQEEIAISAEHTAAAFAVASDNHWARDNYADNATRIADAGERAASAAAQAAEAAEREIRARTESGAAFEGARDIQGSPDSALISDGAVNVKNLNAALYDQAAAAGASSTALAALGVATGVFSEEEARAYLQTMALTAEAERLGKMIAEGKISVDGAVGALGMFADNLTDEVIPASETAATRMGDIKTELMELDGQNAHITVTADTSEAEAALQAFFAKVIGQKWEKNIDELNANGGTRALGGPVEPGRRYRVGERGAEDFVPWMPGHIAPAAQGGPVQVTVTNNFTGQVGTRELTAASERMANRLALLMRNEGRALS